MGLVCLICGAHSRIVYIWIVRRILGVQWFRAEIVAFFSLYKIIVVRIIPIPSFKSSITLLTIRAIVLS